MCGIAGVFHYGTKKAVDLVALERMYTSMGHRGPDDSGYYLDPEAGLGLGHTRLSIIDVTGGKQPLANDEEKKWIAFNGEIYNFHELRRDLESKGYRFRTNSDTEVIVNLVEEHGDKAISMLNGIFGFAIYDKKQRSLILARDLFGVKPLYYSLSSESVVFGSEIKAILESGLVESEVDFAALNSFLTFRYSPSPQTLFAGIRKLHPGYYLKVSSGGTAQIKSFITWEPQIQERAPEREVLEEYRRLLRLAVRRQMISDVPVGLLLSGGIDSATIGYLMQQESGGRTKTFTIGFAGKGTYNELADARETAKLIGSDHHETTISQSEYLDFFVRSFHYTEEPISEPTIPALYHVAKLAGRHVKVVLAGQGADELMAGYHRYLGTQLIHRYSFFLRRLPIPLLLAAFGSNERVRRGCYTLGFTSEFQRFLATYTIFTPEEKDQLLNQDSKAKVGDAEEDLLGEWYSQTTRLTDPLSKMLFIDTRMSLSDNLLLFNDKMTMANSLEQRVPFLDIELVRFVESLPPSFKRRGTMGKYLHKQAVEKWIPRHIIQRKKRGFETPMHGWLQSELGTTAKALFQEKESACNRFFNLDFVNRLIDSHISGRRNFQRHMFLLLSFELWYRMFFGDAPLTIDRWRERIRGAGFARSSTCGVASRL